MRGTCTMCRQDRQLVDGGVCDACTMGLRHRLRYECQQCGGAQMVESREHLHRRQVFAAISGTPKFHFPPLQCHSPFPLSRMPPFTTSACTTYSPSQCNFTRGVALRVLVCALVHGSAKCPQILPVYSTVIFQRGVRVWLQVRPCIEIPHPMWRYQPGPAEFGHASWACHVACGDYTKWRVLPSDLPLVPLADAPESWCGACPCPCPCPCDRSVNPQRIPGTSTCRVMYPALRLVMCTTRCRSCCTLQHPNTRTPGPRR